MELIDIASAAAASTAFRRVLWTGRHTQLVVMTIPAGGEIGLETHEGNDQLLTILTGRGTALVDGDRREVGPGDLLVVPAGAEHNVTAADGAPLVLSTVYAPPDHADGTVHATKEEADAAEAAGEDHPPA